MTLISRLMVTCSLGLKKACNQGISNSKQGHGKITRTNKITGPLTCLVRIFSKAFLLASLLQVQTSGCHGCGDHQVTWRSKNAAQNDTCLPCIDCPDGMEPSIRCGSVAKHGTDLHCVACRKGTYSDTYDKDQCRPCSLCSEARTAKRNCSAEQNTVCGSCSYGYYLNDVVSSCLPCSICCWDGKDQLESQCIDQGLPNHRRCKPRHKDGCELSTTATKASASTGGMIVIANPTTMKRTIPTRKTMRSSISAAMVQLDSTETQLNSSTVPFQSLLSATGQQAAEITRDRPTSQTFLNQDPTGKNRKTTPSMHLTTSVVYYGKARRFVAESTENKRRIIMAVVFSMVALILLVAIINRNTIAHYLRWIKCRPVCRSRDSELGEGTQSTVLDESSAPVTVPELNGVLFPLKKLKRLSLDTYERVWKRLDKQPKNKGDFRAVAGELWFDQEDIWELEKELKTSGSGSPSRQLLEALEARRPNLTVFELIIVLQKPNIDREDVVAILKDYLFQ